MARVRMLRALVRDSVIDLFADRQSSDSAGEVDNEAIFKECVRGSS